MTLQIMPLPRACDAVHADFLYLFAFNLQEARQ